MRDGSIPAHAGEPSWPGSWATRAAVDPRSRGGARSFPHRPFQCLGRSPLTRGSRIKHPQRSVRHGSIPAHAGEPPASVSSISLIQVDPRSRGGALATPTHGTVAGGRSPLTRGSLGGNAGTGTRERSIPAHAGEPGLIDYLRRDLGVDPRSRGGAPSGSLTTPTCRGRSPLTRGSRGRRLETGGRERSIPAHAGEPYHAKSISKPAMVDPRSRGGAHQFFHLGSLGQGRSPLTRGSLPLLLPQRGPRRSIPAHAGEPRSERPWAREMGVDPRSRGGADLGPHRKPLVPGRSPLTRGSPVSSKPTSPPSGSIPAHAGEPLYGHDARHGRLVDPRSRGGAVVVLVETWSGAGRSPLTRGSRGISLPAAGAEGSIPAHAGEPPLSLIGVIVIMVDPRSRGGAASTHWYGMPSCGRSPLTRGSLRAQIRAPRRRGSIPAHAGEPLDSLSPWDV